MTGWEHRETTLYDELRSLLDAQLPAAVELRHRLHADPRPSGAEQDTVTALLGELGESGAARTADGLVVRVGAADRPAIGLRAELDALPVAESGSVPWASTNGSAHLCGHDVHMAALVAVVRALRLVEPPPLPLVAVFQPREESLPCGAADMIASPVLLEQGLAAFLGVHLQPRIPSGHYSAPPGPINASADEFFITVTGVGGHGAYPHVTRDPVVAAAALVMALQTLVSRRIDPMHPTVVTVGSITGGTTCNAVPNEVRLSGTVRSFDRLDREELLGLVGEVATAVATAHGCGATTTVGMGEPVLRNDPGLAEAVGSWIERSGLVAAEPVRSCGADDFSFYSTVVPSLMVFVGVGTAAASDPGLHHPAFLPPDSAVGVVAHTMLAAYAAACARVAPSPADLVARG
jgi:amidohydrolase